MEAKFKIGDKVSFTTLEIVGKTKVTVTHDGTVEDVSDDGKLYSISSGTFGEPKLGYSRMYALKEEELKLKEK